jgi:hypothetical protein
MADDTDTIVWRPSPTPDGGPGVETALLPDGTIGVRNAADPDAGMVVFTRAEIDAFVKGVKAGEFDDLAT